MWYMMQNLTKLVIGLSEQVPPTDPPPIDQMGARIRVSNSPLV